MGWTIPSIMSPSIRYQVDYITCLDNLCNFNNLVLKYNFDKNIINKNIIDKYDNLDKYMNNYGSIIINRYNNQIYSYKNNKYMNNIDL